MQIMKFNEPKLRQLIDTAEDTHVALLAVTERIRELKSQHAQLQSKIETDRRKTGTAVLTELQSVDRIDSEITQLRARQERLHARWTAARSVVDACESWVAEYAGQRRSAGSVITVGGRL